jgi:hypothetical protein
LTDHNASQPKEHIGQLFCGDSHADQCFVGATALIISETSKTVEVGPFLKSLGLVNNVRVVSAAITCDEPHTGHPVVLIIHKALYFDEMEHILPWPVQLRTNQVVVNERPNSQTINPTVNDHSLSIDDEFLIPLSIRGINSVFPFRTPTVGDMDQAKRYELTSPEPEWDPLSDFYQQEEDNVVSLLDGYQNVYNRNLFVSAAAIYSPFKLYYQTQNTMIIDVPFEPQEESTATQPDVSALLMEKSTYVLFPEQLCRTWGIGLTAAKRT